MHISPSILCWINSSNARGSNNSTVYSFKKYIHLLTISIFLNRNRGMDINFHMVIQTVTLFTTLVYYKINLI